MIERVDVAAEKIRIQEVITRLFVGTDRRDWAQVRRCMAPTVFFDMTSLAGGEPTSLTAEQITSGWEAGLAPIEAVHHQAGNFLVDLDGDRATASCYGIALHYKKTASGRNTRTFVGSYDFVLNRARGEWFINSFCFNVKFLDGNLELDKGMKRVRADLALVQQGLAPSREKARALILAGEVLAGDRPIDKAGDLVDPGAELRLRSQPAPYVSRGGVKLAHALDAFAIDPRGLVALDVGASTGGFTDCLLQRGAARVYCVDVGHGQLDWKIASDPRVRVLDRVNIRLAPPDLLPERADLVVIDVSFISLRLVLPALVPLAKAGAPVVALVKPQFEVGRADVGKGGVVRDEAARQRALAEVRAAATALGYAALADTVSPITGGKGNVELLLHLRSPA